MDFSFSDEQREWQNKARHFALSEVSPQLDKLENDDDLKKQLYQKMGKAGFFTISLEEEYGGKGSYLAYLLALKEISQVDAGVGVTMAVTSMVAETVAKFGSLFLKEKILAKIITGECVPLSFALTEQHVGSDAKHIETRAVYDDANQAYVINGEKWFITNADLSPYTIVLAKTADGETTAFLVSRQNPGFSVIYKEKKLGLLVANLVRLGFNKCLVSPQDQLGQRGEGFKIMMNSLNSGRLGIAAQAIGIAEAAFEAALQYSSDRHQFSQPLNQHEVIAFKLADMRLKLDAAKLLMYKACWLKEEQLNFQVEASEAKLFCSEICLEVVNEAVQIFGARGYVKDYPLEKYYRDAKATTLYEGTSEIQRLVISRELIKSFKNKEKEVNNI